MAPMRYIRPFSAFQEIDGQVTLKDARRNPKIVYRTVEHVSKVPQVVRAPTRRPCCALTLLPLHVAAARPDIKYRPEGFEMKAARRPASVAPVDFDDELALRFYS